MNKKHKNNNGETPESAPAEELEEEELAPQEDEELLDEETEEQLGDTDELEAENERLKEELEQAKDKLLRTAAEYDNYRKRTEREKHESSNFGAANAIAKLLPAVDALDRAAEAESTDAEYKKGVEMTFSMLESALVQAGVEEIEALGAPFDPNFHNAVATDEADDEHESGTVTRVLQKGYKLGERVIRPSMVAVAQ